MSDLISKVKVTKEEAQAERRALTTKLKQIVFAVYDCKCAVCGYTNNPEFMVDREKLISGELKANGNAIHHIEPVHLGGKTVLDNLILLCPTHHTETHAGIIDCEDYAIRTRKAIPKLCCIFNGLNSSENIYNPNLAKESVSVSKLLTAKEYRTVKKWWFANKGTFDYIANYLSSYPAEKSIKAEETIEVSSYPEVKGFVKTRAPIKTKKSTTKTHRTEYTGWGDWIKPSEVLPQKGEWVLIYYNSAVEQGVKLAKWTGENFLRNSYFTYNFDNIGCWISLSEIDKFAGKILPAEGEEVLIWYKYPFESEANIKLLKWTKDNQYSDFITCWVPSPTPPVDNQFMTDEDKYHMMKKFFEAHPKLLETVLTR